MTTKIVLAYRKKLAAATLDYLMLKYGLDDPDGTVDSKGRFFPPRQYSCCKKVARPTSRNRHSLKNHCRTRTHVANSWHLAYNALVIHEGMLYRLVQNEQSKKHFSRGRRTVPKSGIPKMPPHHWPLETEIGRDDLISMAILRNPLNPGWQALTTQA
ncbi:MAG: hypothetical protein K8T26_01580 [Lentisphaerae bacterium]|nr:hypothetical protein [Lentisphaerota bacterium]